MRVQGRRFVITRGARAQRVRRAGVAVLVAAAVSAAGATPQAKPQAAGTQKTAPAAAVSPQPPQVPQVAAQGSCLQCHGELVKRAVTHEAAADCASCHVQEKGHLHRFQMAAEGGALCTGCHEVVTKADTFVHGPVAVSDCVTCHDPHGSANPHVLRTAGAKLCEQCHEDVTAKLASKRYAHAPVRTDCAGCHNPHASPYKYQLKGEGQALCLTCHKDTAKLLAASPVKHEATSAGAACLTCHEPHAADIRPQLRAASATLCLSCHDKPLQSPSGPVQDIKAWMASNPNLHGPLKQQDCVGCHRPHESDHFRLLKQDYPARFYSPFEPKNYELCFTCHQPDLVRVQRTASLTGFRNGDRNLHYVHVNRPDKGRTCRACHEAHSSTEPKHLRKTVPFGNWSLPIKFESAPDGGKCAPGCHVPYEYSRSAKAAPDAPR